MKIQSCMHVLPCYKWIWSYLSLWTPTYLHSVFFRFLHALFFRFLHAQNPTIQTQDSWLSHFHLLWTQCLEFTPTRHKAMLNLHLLRRTLKLSYFHSTSVPVNFSSHFSYQKLYLCVCVSVCLCACMCECLLMLVCVCSCVCILILVCVYWFAPFICSFVKLLCVCICFSLSYSLCVFNDYI